MAVTEVMHNPYRADIEEAQEQRALTRGGPCLVCGEWIDVDTSDAYRVLVSQPPREAEYACHVACFTQIKHPSCAEPA
jgi:hypothetical protein